MLAAAGVWLARWLSNAEREALAESAERQKVPRLPVAERLPLGPNRPEIVRNGSGW
jgi:hypothetical protein